ncbi:hypothetical protein JG688_00014172 [Phytophthora aleatoria]|uniref:Uncharacterized protein n=1 Tax=Phytophthora aleatoria TaxID=2496075 RepID=A0A8J5LXQ9_9STRA|nr:hypothetical protein JG688_00014172 [Phytophthora aleatoria]
MFDRSRLPHFRNHTNSRLESNFGKLKLNLESSATMKECLEVLMRFQQRSQNGKSTGRNLGAC